MDNGLMDKPFGNLLKKGGTAFFRIICDKYDCAFPYSSQVEPRVANFVQS